MWTGLCRYETDAPCTRPDGCAVNRTCHGQRASVVATICSASCIDWCSGGVSPFIWYIFIWVFDISRRAWKPNLKVWWKFSLHDDVIKWKHFPRYWPFVRGIHRSPVDSPRKGQWCGALMFPLIWAWINGCHCAHYGVIVMNYQSTVSLAIRTAGKVGMVSPDAWAQTTATNTCNRVSHNQGYHLVCT